MSYFPWGPMSYHITHEHRIYHETFGLVSSAVSRVFRGRTSAYRKSLPNLSRHWTFDDIKNSIPFFPLKRAPHVYDAIHRYWVWNGCRVHPIAHVGRGDERKGPIVYQQITFTVNSYGQTSFERDCKENQIMRVKYMLCKWRSNVSKMTRKAMRVIFIVASPSVCDVFLFQVMRRVINQM